MNLRIRQALPPVLALVVLCAAPVALAALQLDPFTASEHDPVLPLHTLDEIRHAVVRLPLAAALGALLAFRPKRRGTPPRQVAVIQTQIILAIVRPVVLLAGATDPAHAFGLLAA